MAFDFNNIKIDKKEILKKSLKNITKPFNDEIEHKKLFNILKKLAFNEAELKAVADRCEESSIIIDGESISSLLYKHPGLYGKWFTIPGVWAQINYGRKNSKSLYGDNFVHYKEVPKYILDYIKHIEKQGFSNIKVLKNGNFGLIAAIDKNKEIHALWDIWETGYTEYKIDGEEIK